MSTNLNQKQNLWLEITNSAAGSARAKLADIYFSGGKAFDLIQ